MTVISPFMWDWKLITGTSLCFIGGAISAGGGIGGGAFYLSAFILILGMDAHTAVPLSKVTILGLAVGGLIVLMPQRHPRVRARPLIDYDAALILQPTVLLGSVAGVFANVLSPTWLIVVALTAVFGLTSFRAIRKGIQMRRKELAAEKATKAESAEDHGAIPMVTVAESAPVAAAAAAVAVVVATRPPESPARDDGSIPDLPEIPSCRKKHGAAIAKFGVMTAVMVGVFAFLFVKGGSSGSSLAGIECGSAEYWGVVAAVCPFLAAITGVIIWWLRARRIPTAVAEGDLTFSAKQTVLVTLGGVLAGLVSSALGIGGGIVVGPLLLDLGMIPQVATATSSFLIIFMASSSTFQYLLMGKLPLYHAAWYFGVGFASAVVGQLLVVWLIKKTKKQFVVDFLLAGIIILSALAMAGLLIVQLIGDIKTKTGLWFNPICTFPHLSSSSSSW